MSKMIVIGGDTTTGKSTSYSKVSIPAEGVEIQGLDPKCTFLFNVMPNKSLASKFAADNFTVENKNILNSNNYDAIKEVINKISSSEKGRIKNIVIDDFQYLMTLDYLSKKDQTGFQKFAVMGFAVVDLIMKAMATKNDLIVFLLTHTDEEVTLKGEIKVKLKTIGKMLDDTFKLAGFFTILLEAYKEYDEMEDKMKYMFRVRPNSAHSIAKSPIDMFLNENGTFIKQVPNDLGLVEQIVRKFYNI